MEELHYDTIYKDEDLESKENLAEINFDLDESGRWLLKVVGGPNNGAEFSMQRPMQLSDRHRSKQPVTLFFMTLASPVNMHAYHYRRR